MDPRAPNTPRSRRSHPVRAVLASRVVNALTTPHGIDHYLSALHPRWSVGTVRATVTNAQRSAPETVTLTLKPNWNWAGFKAGQFVTLNVDIDGVQRSRCFSPASSAHRADGQIELTIKAQRRAASAAGDSVTAWLVDHAEAGLHCTLSQAAGTFHLPEQRPDHLLLISGGSGITPVLSMLRTLLDESYTGPITFVHYARTPNDVPYLDTLAELAQANPNLNLALRYTAGQPSQHFSADQITEVDPDHPDAAVYVCGPAPLQDAVIEHWASIDRVEQVQHESFGAPRPSRPAAPESIAGDVLYSRSERSSPNNGDSLLEQAEAAGLRPKHGCRMGICASCTCTKRSGTVRNLQTGALSSEPDEDIRLCISAPVGNVTLDL